jgi:hypothetical protein
MNVLLFIIHIIFGLLYMESIMMSVELFIMMNSIVVNLLF